MLLDTLLGGERLGVEREVGKGKGGVEVFCIPYRKGEAFRFECELEDDEFGMLLEAIVGAKFPRSEED